MTQAAKSSIRGLPHKARIAALADDGVVAVLGGSRPSPHLGRFSIVPHDDDGVVVARIAIGGHPILVAAQDERFLRGSVGESHGKALTALFERAIAERPAAAVLLLASGGVRLHEANAAELALARALAASLDARAAGIPIAALAVGDVFGGASVLACAASTLALLPGTRIGVSGPKVLASMPGTPPPHATRSNEREAIFSAEARVAAGHAILLTDAAQDIRSWVRTAISAPRTFADEVAAEHDRLASSDVAAVPVPSNASVLSLFPGAIPLSADGWLWRSGDVTIARPVGAGSCGVDFLRGMDDALRGFVDGNAGTRSTVLVVIEDSAGHEVSRAAESRFLSRYLAHHAALLALARARGHRVVGVLAGTGHSAAFFANALQGAPLFALPDARVVAMEAHAIARVTGLDVAALVRDDPLLGQPVRHFAAQGGVDAIVESAALPAAIAAATSKCSGRSAAH